MKKKGWYDWHQISRIFDNELSFRDLTSCYNAATLKNDIFVKIKKKFLLPKRNSFFRRNDYIFGPNVLFLNRLGMGI